MTDHGSLPTGSLRMTAQAPAADTAATDWLDGTLALVVLALAFLLASFAATNSDLWLHLAAGRLVAHGQYPFGADPFSALTDPTPVWVNHAWLFHLLLHGLYQAAGGPALVIAKAVLAFLLAGVLMFIRRPG